MKDAVRHLDSRFAAFRRLQQAQRPPKGWLRAIRDALGMTTRSRLHPSWLSRTVTLGEMYEPDDALIAGLLDRVVSPEAVEAELDKIIAGLRAIHTPSHATAKKRLRQTTMDAVRAAIDRELTMSAYQASSQARSAVALPRSA